MRASSFARSIPPMADDRALLYCAGGGVGDSLVASGVVDALTLRSHAPVLERVPDVDGVLVDDGGEERALANRLAERRYGACIVTWATPRTARVPQAAGIPIRVGQSRRFYSFRFTKRVLVRSERGDVTSHWSDILLDYARAIGCDVQVDRYRFNPTPEDEREADALRISGRFAILNPCNAVASRSRAWPLEAWIALARALHERFEAPVLITGSESDAPIADSIARRADDPEIASIAGRTTIGAFGALARRAAIFVGITTGSMHVAAAVGCPTVGIFPFQSDFPDRWAPLGAQTAIVRPSYPCHRGDTKERCRDYACIANLDLPRILSAAELLTA
jgi:ADP-heptose:LPS heptosyltransferase